jgi:hypothetical protein
MKDYEITIEWDGPYKTEEVIKKKNDAGNGPLWDGADYGIYQIYGDHILSGKNTLLYVGIATERTFSQRFKEHQDWIAEDQKEEDVSIYLGRIKDSQEYPTDELWTEDVKLIEKILIYKYSPNYSSRELATAPDLSPREIVRLLHTGNRGRLEPIDNAPEDYFV